MSASSLGINLRFINYLMKEINECSDDIYEGLVDKEHGEVVKSSNKLISILTELNESLKDDLETKT